MNYGYLYSAIMLVSMGEVHAMNNGESKRHHSEGIPISQPSVTFMEKMFQQDAVSRRHDYLCLKCAFATFIERVEKNRQVLAALSKELEDPGENLKKAAALSLMFESLNTLRDEVRAGKQLIAQNSGGNPATPPPSLADESFLPE